MFVRKKRNRSGTTSVSVVFKSGRTFKEVHHLGSSTDPAEIHRMYSEGQEWIALYGGQQLIDFEEKSREEVDMFDVVGFDFDDVVFRDDLLEEELEEPEAVFLEEEGPFEPSVQDDAGVSAHDGLNSDHKRTGCWTCRWKRPVRKPFPQAQ